MHLPTRQRGLALLVLLALFATAAAYLLVTSLNKSSAALSVARAQTNQDVMAQAKAALLAYAASNALTAAIPGSLPCPDRNNNGNAEPSCSGVNLLGRLPYKTLGIGELRDTSGELLWYAVSTNFRTGASVINSDTQGTLTISGLAPASNAVAVVLAPGMPVTLLSTGLLQNRTPTGTNCNSSGQACNTASNYLEDINGDTNTADYIAAVENTTKPSLSPYPFNDQLLVITQQDLMSVVEPVIAGRIRRDIVLQYIYNSDVTLTDSGKQWSDDNTDRNKSRYFDAWGGFPFAAPFTNPSSSSFTGTTGTYEGLLPVVDVNYTWSSGSVVQTGGSGTVWGGSSCSPVNFSTDLQCNIWYQSGAPRIRVSGTVNNVGRGFVQLTRLSDVSCSGCTLSSRSVSGSLNSAGAGIVTVDATMNSVGGWTNVTVTVRNDNLITSPLVSPTDGIAGWFTTNNWHMDTYYAVSPGYAPGGGGTCNVTSPKCLSINNLPSPYANPTTDTRAIVILAGRSLSASPSRPNGTLSDYLEGQNASTGNYVYEHGLAKTTQVAGSPVGINDRVIVIAP
jgi:hypothetical protein